MTENSRRNENGIIEKEKLTTQQKIWFTTGAIIKASWPVALYMLLPAVVISVGYFFTGRKRDIDTFILESGNFYTVIGILLVLLILIRRAKKMKINFFEEVTLEFDKSMIPKLLILLAMGICIAVSVSAIITVIPMPKFLISDYEDSSQALYKGTDIIFMTLCQIFLAPFTEEVVFRGFMLNRLLRQFNEKACVIVVSLVFGLCHISGIWVIYAIGIGFLLTKISIREDNILHSIILHAGFNMPAIVIYIINSSPALNEAIFGKTWQIISYGIIFAGLSVLLWRLYNKEKKYVEED